MQEDILDALPQFGQQHLLQHYNSLTDPALKEAFLKQLTGINFKQTNQLYQDVYLHSKNNPKTGKVNFEPLAHVADRAQIRAKEAEFNKLGMEAVAKGEVGACIMSGGQGTRLGFDHPKGMFNLGLESNCTLFEYFVRSLLRLNELAKREFPDSKWEVNNMTKLYLMTSEMNHNEIVDFFSKHNYFGYDPSAIFFFPQGGIPAVDYNGKIMIESEGNISLAPGGNGVIYLEMKEKGALDHMKKNGVKYVYITPVDNVLVKLGDPTCAGFMIKHGFDIVSTYVKKAYPEEKVGIHVLTDGKVSVVEYSEVPKEVTEKSNEKGELVYCHGNRATIFMSTDFIEKITTSEEVIQKINRKYHLAEKKIKFYDPITKTSSKPDHNNGIKFELFYFDVFEECSKFGLFETIREEEFAPLKNPDGLDSPASARKLLKDLHMKWLIESGVKTEGEGCVEIDPRVCYKGEGLKELVDSKYGGTVKLPAYID